MRWDIETAEEKYERQRNWRLWFAWYPIRIDNQRVWLEFVETRLVDERLYDYGEVGMEQTITRREYRTLEAQ